MFDTIASISTALTPSGIGIVRLSGDKSIAIANELFVSAHANKKLIQVKSHTINYGHIIDPTDQSLVDEVMVSVMKGPNSYTKEDVVEINCHGGIMILENVLKLLLQSGARLAEPGEFTKRAFLNGRLDLSQAEAVMDLIHSKTQLSLKSSVSQLKGKLSLTLNEIKASLIGLIAHIEASIDYPEYEIGDLSLEQMTTSINENKSKIQALVQSFDNGKIIREGIKTAIIGKPNVGKSSLLNALLRENRAIVTDIPGTTRDVLEEYMNIHGIPIKLIDTAGIRSTEDQIERIGVERSMVQLEEADLIIFMLDVSRPLDHEDRHIMSLIADKEIVCLMNKIDLVETIDRQEIRSIIGSGHMIDVSTKNLDGIDALEQYIRQQFIQGDIDLNNEVYITNVRHKNALVDAVKSLTNVLESIEIGMPEDCWSIDIKDAYDHIGIVTGDSVSEDMMAEIFSRFCLGK